jgi:hypothetical protein
VERDGSVWHKVSEYEGAPTPPLELMHARPAKNGEVFTFSHHRRRTAAEGARARPKVVARNANEWRRLTAGDLAGGGRDATEVKVLDLAESRYQAAYGWYQVRGATGSPGPSTWTSLVLPPGSGLSSLERPVRCTGHPS